MYLKFDHRSVKSERESVVVDVVEKELLFKLYMIALHRPLKYTETYAINE